MLSVTALAPGIIVADGVPTNVCHEHCGPHQQHIWARFKQGDGMLLNALPTVYAGICHVLGDRIDPEREHHVGFLLDHRPTDHSPTTAGDPHHTLLLRFSFFTAMQPYDQLDADQAREYFGAPVLALSVRDDHAYAEALSRRFFARYWFRREPASGRVLLVSYFGDRVTILCDAGANFL